jgi:acetylornithine deacetylase
MNFPDKLTDLLFSLIETPSFSREEAGTAQLLTVFLKGEGAMVENIGNNVIARFTDHDPVLPTVLLVSHHDTVKPNPGYLRDPFKPALEDGRIYGLGSNDAGGPLVCLIGAFLHYLSQPLRHFNLVLAACAEEEVSGQGGVESCLPRLGLFTCAIVGEPTSLRMAVAERGLLVVDAVCHGAAGHAARAEGVNAIYQALPDLEWIRTYQFAETSNLLGPVTMQVTMIQAGTQHNVVPAACNFTIDIRLNELYTHEEVIDLLRRHLQSIVTPRSTRLRATGLPQDHPLAKAGKSLGLESYGSPTLSDKALLPCPALKIGPGESARSHSADEYIGLSELESGLDTYIRLLSVLKL